MPYTIDDIASMIDAVVEGNGSEKILGLAEIDKAGQGQLSFISNPKYLKYIETTSASAVLVDHDFPKTDRTTLLRTANPYFAFLQLAQTFYQQKPQVAVGVHPTAVIGDGCELGADIAIGAHVVIGSGCKIGAGSVLFPGVVLGDQVKVGEKCIIYANVSVREQCVIGNRVIIQMGAVIGSDGFGFAFEGGKYHKIPQMGIVVIEDDVEIGANTTIDRATIGETRIAMGAKIDNLVQIAHNVQIGEHTAIAAQAGISGSTKVGRYVRMGGQAGLIGHIEVGDQAAIGAQAGITKSVPEKQFVSGYPARPHMQAKREEASLAKLPELIKKVRRLESELQALKDNKE